MRCLMIRSKAVLEDMGLALDLVRKVKADGFMVPEVAICQPAFLTPRYLIVVVAALPLETDKLANLEFPFLSPSGKQYLQRIRGCGLEPLNTWIEHRHDYMVQALEALA